MVEPRVFKDFGMRTFVIMAGLAGVAGCGSASDGAAFIEGVLRAPAPLCTGDPQSTDFEPSARVDIDNGAGAATSFLVPLKVRTSLPATFNQQNVTQDQTRSPNFPVYGQADNNIISFENSEVVFTTNDDTDDPALTLEGIPTSERNKRITGVSGVAFNLQTNVLAPSVVYVTALTERDIALLRADPIVNEVIYATSDNRTIRSTYRIFANMRLVGRTSGGNAVRTPPFPFPIDLCAGCLSEKPDCGTIDDDNDPETPPVRVEPVNNDEQCSPGVGKPTFVCPP